MQYWKIYNPEGYDEKEDYPLFHCLPLVDTHFKTFQAAKNKAELFPNYMIIERDDRTPFVEVNLTTKRRWKYNGSKWIKSKM